MSFNAGHQGGHSGARDEFSVDPSTWGPHVWATMHTLALKADADSELGPFLEFLNSLTFLLPCGACRHDYSKYYSTNGPPVQGEAFAWTVKLHNWVSAKLWQRSLGHKPYQEWTIEEARANWTSSNCSYKCQTRQLQNSIETISNANGGIAAFACAAVLVGLIVYLYTKRPSTNVVSAQES